MSEGRKRRQGVGKKQGQEWKVGEEEEVSVVGQEARERFWIGSVVERVGCAYRKVACADGIQFGAKLRPNGHYKPSCVRREGD